MSIPIVGNSGENMSKHDCKLVGCLDLKAPIDSMKVEAVLAKCEWDFSYDDSDSPIFIDLKNGEITFDAQFWGYGDSLSDELEKLFDSLEPLLANGGTLEVLDFDCKDSDTVHHIGPSPEERIKAQVTYAVNQLERFAEGLLTKEALDKIKKVALKSALKK